MSTQQAVTGMPNAIGVQTPIYLPSEDPLMSVLFRDLQVDKDNASINVEDITSTVANNSSVGWNVGLDNAKAQFTINSGTDYRLNLSKLALMEDLHLSMYVVSTTAGGTGVPNAPAIGTPNIPLHWRLSGIPAFLPFQIISSISLKVNDSSQAVETYDQAHQYGRLSMLRAVSNYDQNTLEKMDETLFTPVWNYQEGENTADAETTNEMLYRLHDTNTYSDTDSAFNGNTMVTTKRVKRVVEMVNPRRAPWGHTEFPVDQTWTPSFVNRKIIPFPMLLAFCNAKAVSNNIRKLDLEMTFVRDTDQSLGWGSTGHVGDETNFVDVLYDVSAALKDVRVIVTNNRLSPMQNVEYVNDKIGQQTEKFAFLFATCGEQPFNHNTQVPYMNVSNLSHVLFGVETTSLNPGLYRNFERFENPKILGTPHTEGIANYTVRYGIDQFPIKTLNFGGELKKVLPYYLLQKTLNKENLQNFRLGIDAMLYSDFCFILGAKFVESTFPRLSQAKEVRIDINGSWGEPGNPPTSPKLYYALFRYRTVIIAGDGSVVIQD